MVHALQESWRALVPGGRLVDLRPRATNWPLEVVVGSQINLAGKVDNAPFIPDDDAAELAMQHMVHEGWFTLGQQASFDCASYWDTLEAMLSYYAEDGSPPLTLSDSILATARRFTAQAAQETKVRLLYSMNLSIYRKLTPDRQR